MREITLRPYQRACIEAIEARPAGRYLVQMATGLGKTVTFANIPRRGRMLILSHRDELVRQPLKYFDCATSIEQGPLHADPNAEVVSASVQSLSRRLLRFPKDAFDILVCDEAHHAAAQSYRRIFDYFRPRLLLGFTATPGRGDKLRLDGAFDEIIFCRDLRWGIQNGYLTDIYCRRVNIGFDLRRVRTQNGDYAPGELAQAMDGTADAVAQAYRELAVGATLIFAVSVHQAQEIARRIPGSAVVTGETGNRQEILNAFTRREIPCLVNVMVFTEGTDLPLVETVIIARPTQSDSLYTQMVGRGLRRAPGKERLNLIDCVGVTGKASLCTAPTLLGLDIAAVPEKRQSELEGLLFELPELVQRAGDSPESWIRNIEIVNLWARAQKYETHGVNWFKLPDGSLVCSLPHRRLRIPCPDALGVVHFSDGQRLSMQEALDAGYLFLQKKCPDEEYIWNLRKARGWGKYPASEKQLALIRRRCPNALSEIDTGALTKLQASQILNRVMCGRMT